MREQRAQRREDSQRRSRVSTPDVRADEPPAGDRPRDRAGPGRVPAHQQLGTPHRRALAPGLARARPGLRRGPAPRHPRRRGVRLRLATGGGSSPRGFSGLRRGRPFGDPEGRTAVAAGRGLVPGVLAGCSSRSGRTPCFARPLIVATSMFLLGARPPASPTAPPSGRGEALKCLGARRPPHRPGPGLRHRARGVSRSGATISMALFLGYKREEAARFSFLLAMPITLGAVIYKVPKLFAPGRRSGRRSWPASSRPGSSASSSIRLLLAFVRRPRLPALRLLSLRFRGPRLGPRSWSVAPVLR